MRLRRIVTTVGTLAALGATTLLSGATSAGAVSAPGGCWIDPDSGTSVFYCNNRTPVWTYKAMSFSSGQEGWLYSNPSWFECWSEGDDNNAGGKWLYTKGDTGGAGFIPANEASITSFPAAWLCDFG